MLPADRLPEHWREWLRARANALSNGKYAHLSAGDFPSTPLRLRFPDGSHATFEHSFAVADESRRELAVFTEHCGYHVFSLVDVECDPAPQSSS